IIQTLLEHGADISQKDNHGETALHYAARGRDIFIVQTLLEGGADTSQKDKHGETALHYA
ncbi:ankyrin repeat domain-containing protein, partial [Aspergillus glaucus CBS 516.65]